MRPFITFILLSLASVGHIQCENANYRQIQVNDASDLDRLWENYFYTRDRTYLRAILETISQDPTTMIIGFEYLNRIMIANVESTLTKKVVEPDFSDIIASIGELEKTMPDILSRVSIVTAALWSMESNISQYPQVNEDFKTILQAEPHLNYRKSIQAMLGK